MREARKSGEQPRILANVEPGKAGRRYSKHLGRMVKDDNSASDDGVLASILALPKRITDHRARYSATGPVVVRREQAASNRDYSEHGKHFPAHPQGLSQSLLISPSDGIPATAPCEKFRKCSLLLSDL